MSPLSENGLRLFPVAALLHSGCSAAQRSQEQNHISLLHSLRSDNCLIFCERMVTGVGHFPLQDVLMLNQGKTLVVTSMCA